MRLCYMNCLLWAGASSAPKVRIVSPRCSKTVEVLLPQENLRWRLKDFGLKEGHVSVQSGKMHIESRRITIQCAIDK